ncbi:MAG: arsenate reductase ArsC [Candidatus Thermoplasmatota archaeon]
MKKILFVCVGNTCRSQMAKGFFNAYAKNVEADSAGLNPGDRVDSYAVQVMKEKGIDISGFKPKMFTSSMNKEFDYIVTMGCMDGCPVTPRDKTIEWRVEDPKGKTIDEYRKIRNEIEKLVKKLIQDIE